MTIIPDTKDWTWVLHRPCPECGFTVETFARYFMHDPVHHLYDVTGCRTVSR
jgi:hypothetical protein